MRPAVVRSRRPLWLGHLAPRRRLHLRPGHLRAIQCGQWLEPRGAGAPACDGGPQLGARPERCHHLLGSQLLLSLRCVSLLFRHSLSSCSYFTVLLLVLHSAQPAEAHTWPSAFSLSCLRKHTSACSWSSLSCMGLEACAGLALSLPPCSSWLHPR